MKVVSRTPLQSLLVTAVTVFFLVGPVQSPVAGRALPEGFVLTPDNLDAHLDDTFQGRTIRSMITPGLRRRVEEDGQKIKLKNYPDFTISEEFRRATERFSDEVGYDPSNQQIQNYTAGLPYPNLGDGVRHRGAKAMYNHWWGAPLFQFASDPSSHTLLIDGENGLERKLISTAQQYRFINQWHHIDTNEPLVEGDGIHNRGLFFVRFPQDLRGIGTFTINYTTGRLSDAWVYVRSLRRVRRVSGGSWMKRVPGGLDAFGDSLQGPVQHPSWYPGFEYQGTRTVLVPRREPGTLPSRRIGGQEYRYLAINTKRPPHWNWNSEYVGYEPRKVHVIKMNLPDAHTLGHRIVYLDDTHWMQNYAEEFDKNGNLSQFVSLVAFNQEGPNGIKASNIWAMTVVNWKAHHATSFTINRKPTVNAEVGPTCISLDQLRLAQPCTP